MEEQQNIKKRGRRLLNPGKTLYVCWGGGVGNECSEENEMKLLIAISCAGDLLEVAE